jgi:uncharacterized protein YkwD
MLWASGRERDKQAACQPNASKPHLTMLKHACRALILAAPFLLAACAERQPAPTAPPIEMNARERAASQVHVDPVAAADVISQHRRDHALGTVQPDPVLQKFAQAQADAMAARDTLSHELNGDLKQRLDAAHLGQLTAVENVSAGYFSLPDVVAGWRRSPAHDANLLDPPMRRMGIATAYAPGTRYKVYWALVMSN